MRATVFRFFVILFFFCLAVGEQVAAQCAMCRTTVENNVSHGDTSLASGLNIGILYLFVMPYLLFTVLAVLWYKKSRQNAKKVHSLRYPKL